MGLGGITWDYMGLGEITCIDVIIYIGFVTTSYMSKLQRDGYPKSIEDTL